MAVTFEHALRSGDLDEARAILDRLAEEADTGGLWLPECYGNLAKSFGRTGRYEDAIAAQERAIELGWDGVPDLRSDIAEFHLRAGRPETAAAIWEELKQKDLDDVWLYNAAGLAYSATGDHELAVQWLTEGLELALRTGDPEGIAAQMSDERRQNLEALGREPDELERRVDEFLPRWREQEQQRKRTSLLDLQEPAHVPLEHDDDPWPPEHREGQPIAAAFAWFPAGEYEKAIERWPDLASDWSGVPHPDYCHRMDGHIKWLRSYGLQIRAVAPIVVDDYVAWCEERGEDPNAARSGYAADRFVAGEVVHWPPGRNEPCWCGSGRKYKKCCGPAPSRPMHDREP